MRVAGALLCVSLCVPVAARADEVKAIAPAIEKCIRDNAASVEAAVPDLNSGVDFLANKVCAEPIAAESARRIKAQQDRTAARWKEFCDKQKAAGKPAKGTVDFYALQDTTVTHVGFTGMMNDSDDDDAPYYSWSKASPATTALAARLPLDLRLAHQKPVK